MKWLKNKMNKSEDTQNNKDSNSKYITGKKSLPETLLNVSQWLVLAFASVGLILLIAGVATAAGQGWNGYSPVLTGLFIAGFLSIGIGLFVLFAWTFPLLGLVKKMMNEIFEMQKDQPTRNPFSWKEQIAKTVDPVSEPDKRPLDYLRESEVPSWVNKPIEKAAPEAQKQIEQKPESELSNEELFGKAAEMANKATKTAEVTPESAPIDEPSDDNQHYDVPDPSIFDDDEDDM